MWNSSTPRGAPPTSSSRQASPAPPVPAGHRLTDEAKARMEREFGAGKVYVKQRDEDDGWAGGLKAKKAANASASASASASARPTLVPTPPGGSRAGTPVQQQGKGKGRSAGKENDKLGEQIQLSEAGAAELVAIDRAIKAFTTPPKRRCFCQG